HWLNSPLSGDNSWRREDDGVSASWNNPTFGLYTAAAPEGLHSARFHSYSTTVTGSMDLYVDCSGPGVKTLSFQYINNNTSSGSDNLTIQYSINGAAFISTGFLQGSQPTGGWENITIP